MTVLNLYRRGIQLLFLGLTLSAPASYGAIKFFDLRTPEVAISETPTISQGSALALEASPGSQLWFNGKDVFVSNTGKALIALHRDDTAAVVKVVDAAGKETIYPLNVELREYRIERIDGLPPAKVNAPPDPALRKRIRAESQAIRAARQREDDRQDFLQGFIWPVKGRISGRYGSQRILNGEPKTPHYGVDVAVPTGTKVVAPADGIVIYSNSDMYYSGGTLVIDHGHGLSSAFLHLSKIDVGIGERVKQGQYVARVGATGRATGPHLDWRMNWGASTRVDPQLLVPPMAHKVQ